MAKNKENVFLKLNEKFHEMFMSMNLFIKVINPDNNLKLKEEM